MTQTVLLAHEAAGGQSQSQIPVSAYVVVSSTITATMSATLASTPGAPPGTAPASAPTNTPATQTQRPQICTQVVVSCSGRAPMRLSVDDSESPRDVQECATQSQNTVSLCAAGANGPQGSLGLTIEY